MGDIAVRAVHSLAGLAHRLGEQHAPVLPAAEFPGGFQPHRDALELFQQAQAAQRAHHVGRHDDAGADFAQLGGLLVHRGLEPGPAQEQRRRKAADAPADDRDARGYGADLRAQ